MNVQTFKGKSKNGVAEITLITNIAMLELLGKGLFGKVGIDARIFGTLKKQGISVSTVSQGSSEKGISLVISKTKINEAVGALKKEFQKEFGEKDIDKITVNKRISVLSIICKEKYFFQKALEVLIKNSIFPLLMNNTVSENNISLVLNSADSVKALNVLQGEIFGLSKKINIAIIGHGKIGGTLIDQILNSAENIEKKRRIKLNIFAVCNSKKILLKEKGIDKKWRENIKIKGIPYKYEDIASFAKKHHLENCIFVDNTANKNLPEKYIYFINKSFDIVSSNKVANTLDFNFYQEIREALKKNNKKYLYETNVGAGLPLIDTIGLLHLSGENITKIRGVFSGTLSYLFNNFSIKNIDFIDILKKSMQLGLTEPDPREDLSGKDVGRKLLILARELDLANEFSDIEIENLVPKNLEHLKPADFFDKLNKLNQIFAEKKKTLKKGFVFRYIGELSGDLQQPKGKLRVGLVQVPINSALGQLKGSDSIFEIYTDSYGEQPLVIQGAGAGPNVTARGVFGDILRLA
ncbi:hypothetical protein FACS1894153_2920 [Bacteroidia bacterium]|nr:hypothetical protein FACS1894153_2920 [Bacteroidia bacterium]